MGLTLGGVSSVRGQFCAGASQEAFQKEGVPKAGPSLMCSHHSRFPGSCRRGDGAVPSPEARGRFLITYCHRAALNPPLRLPCGCPSSADTSLQGSLSLKPLMTFLFVLSALLWGRDGGLLWGPTRNEGLLAQGRRNVTGELRGPNSTLWGQPKHVLVTVPVSPSLLPTVPGQRVADGTARGRSAFPCVRMWSRLEDEGDFRDRCCYTRG